MFGSKHRRAHGEKYELDLIFNFYLPLNADFPIIIKLNNIKICHGEYGLGTVKQTDKLCHTKTYYLYITFVCISLCQGCPHHICRK